MRTKINVNISALQNKIGYNFSNIDYLIEALTHSSYSNESKGKSMKYNERIEFLGDSVLNFIISNYMYTTYNALSEGEMTRIRANIVCESSLYEIAKKIDLGKYLLLGRGEEIGGGRKRESVLADALEAVLGAMYLDGGLDIVKKFVIDNFIETINLAIKGLINRDHKTLLQEKVQALGHGKINYKVSAELGPDHNKTFEIELFINDSLVSKGVGKSKKEGEQDAAKKALEGYDTVNEKTQ